jgi:hypothetical protein
MPDQNLLDPADLIAQFGDRIRIGGDCRIAADVVIDVGRDAYLSLWLTCTTTTTANGLRNTSPPGC